jgi:hypothetical protein
MVMIHGGFPPISDGLLREGVAGDCEEWWGPPDRRIAGIGRLEFENPRCLEPGKRRNSLPLSLRIASRNRIFLLKSGFRSVKIVLVVGSLPLFRLLEIKSN